MAIINRFQLPLRILCEQEVQRMSEDEFSAVLASADTHQVILVTFDEETGKTQAAHIIPAEELTQAFEKIADLLDATRKDLGDAIAEGKAALGENSETAEAEGDLPADTQG